MNSLTSNTNSELDRSFSPSRVLKCLMAVALIGCLGLPESLLRAQNIVADNFNDGNDVGWTPYEGAPGTREPSFPSDPQGGFFYRLLNKSGTDANGLFTRGGSYRADVNYVGDDFFSAVDLVNYNDAGMIGVAFNSIAAKLAAVGPAQTTGYVFGYLAGGPNSPMGLLGIIEFQQEAVSTTTPDINTGGAALTPKLDPTKGHRMVLRGGAGGLLIGDLYERTDLLEPLAHIEVRDDLNGAAHPNGFVGLVGVNASAVEVWGESDGTWDNFYSSDQTNNFTGFPGTPQVVNLVPAPQTLFYSIPPLFPITFTATPFASTNTIDTTKLKLFLNGVDVSAQLTFTQVGGPPLGTAGTNFTVQYTGSLSSNTIYNGKIIVVNPADKGTTNTWVFDTFRTNGLVNIEAEDYNYDSGQFQDNPPVSGLDPDGTLVNGGGLGYFDQIGTPGIDYEDFSFQAIGQGISILERNQYRTLDFPGTVQGRMGRSYDVRRQYVTNNVGEYVVGFLTAGDWMNYTRTFPSANYNVYLRAASVKAEAVRFDEVTSDRTLSNQTTAIRGEFLVPKTGGSSRFRYVPLTDAAGNVQTLTLSGVKTFRLTDLESNQRNALDVSEVYLNSLLFVPTAAPASTGEFIGFASPSSGTVIFDPEGTVQISILNRGTSVDIGTIALRFDGVNVTGSATIAPVATGATISYNPPGFLMPDTGHTLNVVFGHGGVLQTNEWSFKVLHMPVLLPSHREATGPDTGFAIVMHKAQNDNPAAAVTASFENTINRAERQVAGTLGNPDTPGTTFPNEAANMGLYTEANAINYQQCGTPAGFFAGDTNFPGLDPAEWCNGTAGVVDPHHFAMSATIKLQLAAGIYRMGWHCDDQVALGAGPLSTNMNYTNAGAIVLGHSQDNPADRTDDANGRAQFDFAVQTNGVYKFRLIMEEGEGGAEAEWFWVNRTNVNLRTLVTPTIPVTVQLLSAATVNGTYSVEGSAVIDTGTKTVTVAKSGNTRFYRLSAASALNITNITLSGSNVVLKYQ